MSFVKNTLKKLIGILPVSNTVMLESVPDLSDNTRAVFDEMIRRGINEKYKLVWIVKEKPAGEIARLKNVSFVLRTDSKRIKLKRLFAKCFVCCNEWLPTMRKGQTSFYLSHGTTIKNLRTYRNDLINRIDWVLSAAEGVEGLCEREFGAAPEKIFSLGFPRNDALVSADRDLHPLFPEVDFEKIVVWYPTYRQHANGIVVSGGSSLPIIHDSSAAAALNEYAREKGVLLVLKPHFAQDVSYVKDMGLSHVRFIDDSFFEKNNISSYEFVGSCDALITDYSSIYYDFTLCDKPIALVWEDYEEYKKVPGFAEGAEEFLSGGEKVYDLEGLLEFVKNVGEGRDVLREERRRICPLVNHMADGNSSARVVDFIVEKAGLN